MGQGSSRFEAAAHPLCGNGRVVGRPSQRATDERPCVIPKRTENSNQRVSEPGATAEQASLIRPFVDSPIPWNG